MPERISELLQTYPSTKARRIATKLGLGRGEVRRLLHDHPDKFEQDEEYQRPCVERVCQIGFTGTFDDDGVALLMKVFKEGALIQNDNDGRGIGLKLSGGVAQ